MLVLDVAHLNRLLVEKLHEIRSLEFDVIVHLPRSGTIPASLLSTYLLKPLASVDEFCANMIFTRKSDFKTLHRILLVDDSVRTGVQMKAAVDKIKQLRPDAEILSLAVYSTNYPVGARLYQPTMYLYNHEDGDYIFPWFMWKTKKISQCAVDMDGVLCRDCTKDEDDDGENYKEFLKNALPKFKTKFPIGCIITGRLSKYRPQTEEWLKRHGIKYNNLIMGEWRDKETRKREGAANWKGKLYKKLPYSLFIESSDKEATIIHNISGKKVWCVDSQRYLHDYNN